jgi:SAM-dependent methyltransferase
MRRHREASADQDIPRGRGCLSRSHFKVEADVMSSAYRLFYFRLLALLALAALPLAGASHAQAPAPQTTQRPTSSPYTGDLSIFETPGREERLQIHRVMDLLGIQMGKSVADIGAGSGWFTVRAARRVAPGGTVYAEDINPKAVAYITQRAAREHLSNIRAAIGTEDDPKLPRQSIDAVLMLKSYHEIAHPVTLLNNLKPALRSGAKIGVIDRNGNGTDHGLDSAVLVKEMAEAGYGLVGRYDFTKADGQDYFLIFAVRR